MVKAIFHLETAILIRYMQ